MICNIKLHVIDAEIQRLEQLIEEHQGDCAMLQAEMDALTAAGKPVGVHKQSLDIARRTVVAYEMTRDAIQRMFNDANA